jgi:Leucine-rich repeat (LRR) protein
MKALTTLSLQANRLTSVGPGLGGNLQLTELYLGQNGLVNLAGVEVLTKLDTLDAGFNRLSELPPLTSLTGLRELWLNNNDFHDWKELVPIKELHDLQLNERKQQSEAEQEAVPVLETVYLEANAVAGQLNYKAKVLQLAPSLKQLDSNYIN